jgi:DNA-binding Xre family transcriptional regulator
MVKVLMRVRLHIREIAEERKITRTRLSRLADLNYATIYALWSGEVDDVYVTTLGKIARALKVPITDLFTLIDEEDE